MVLIEESWAYLFCTVNSFSVLFSVGIDVDIYLRNLQDSWGKFEDIYFSACMAKSIPVG